MIIAMTKTIEEAQKKIRHVRGIRCRVGKRYVTRCSISLPECYVDKKVRVIVVEDEDNQDGKNRR